MSTPLHWFKSSYSGDEADQQCVEVAVSARTIHIRDSKHGADAPTLQISPSTWSAFLAAAPHHR